MQFFQSRRNQILLAVGAAIVLGLGIWLVAWISLNDLWPTVRDIALVVLAIFTLVPLIALSFAVFELVRTITAVRGELVPLLDELKETTHSVKETVKVAGEYTVKPSVRKASFLVGFSQATSMILGRGADRRRDERRRRTREAAARQAEQDKGEPNDDTR